MKSSLLACCIVIGTGFLTCLSQTSASAQICSAGIKFSNYRNNRNFTMTISTTSDNGTGDTYYENGYLVFSDGTGNAFKDGSGSASGSISITVTNPQSTGQTAYIWGNIDASGYQDVAGDISSWITVGDESAGGSIVGYTGNYDDSESTSKSVYMYPNADSSPLTGSYGAEASAP